MQTKPTMKIFDRDCSRLLRLALAALLILGQVSAGYAAPQGGIVRGGSAQITSQGNKTLIQQTTPRAIIDWRSFGVTADEAVRFMQPSTQSATLNRVTGNQVSFLLGRLDANGQILLINPNGIIFGKGAQINVGSLIASTANISNNNFMQGNLIFDQPGKPGAGIVNLGTITAKEGGLIALVAPHIRNDGIIEAKLGKVMLGAADTFTIDLYGDGLINLALSDASLAEIQGTLIAQTGTIDVAGGKAVLITAAVAKGVVDSLINMSGAILADSATQEGGRIVLSARGGNVDVSGQLSATGTKGGQIEILGDQIHLFSPAYLDASGLFGGGILHIGGAYQGSGDTYRSKSTFIDPGVILQADAQQGKGGEVIVWSDEFTSFQGSIFARDGGRVEVSGKNTLFFDGAVDAGKGGSLLLDPYDFTIGAAEAGLIARVLWTGTSTSVSADHNLTVNYDINGTGRLSGGGLTLTAGNNLSINNNLYTNNGAINLFATSGTISLLSGKTIWAGTAPITLRSGSHLYNGAYIVGGPLSLISTAGSVFVDGSIFLTNPNNPSNANLTIQAASDVTISQPVVAESDGNGVTITAGNDITVDNQINTSGGRAGGTISLTANRNLNVNDHIVTNNGAISLFATSGTISLLSGKSVWAGTAPITIQSGGNLSDGTYLTGGPTSLTSTAGSVSIAAPIFFANPSDPANANLTIQAATDVNISQPIVALADGNGVTITAGNDIAVNNPINTSEGRAGGTIYLTSTGGNVAVNDDIATNNGAISLLASTGTISLLTDKVVWAGTAPITVQSAGNLSNGAYITSDQLSLTSTAGSITISSPIASTIGDLTVSAANNVTISQPIVALSDGNSVTIAAGNSISVNAQIDGSGGVTGGTVTLTATSGNVNINDHIVTNDGAITISAGGAFAQLADGTDNFGAPLTKQVRSGSAPITVTSGGDLSFGSLVTTGELTVTSTAADVNINVPIYETTGRTTVNAGRDININEGAVNTTSGADLIMAAGRDINVNAKVGPWDRSTLNSGEAGISRNAVAGGSISLTAGRSILLHDAVASYKGDSSNPGSITLTAGSISQPTGTVLIDNGIKVVSDVGAIQVTGYGDLTNGPYINDQDISVVNGLPTTGYFTAGALGLRSTAGNLTVNQTIPDTTGPVTLQAGNGIQVNQRIYSDNADITLIAGPGGITMTTQVDPASGPGTEILGDIDSRLGNLTLLSEGNIAPSGTGRFVLRTLGTLTATSTNGTISDGVIKQSRRTGDGDKYPAQVELSGSLGISNFSTEYSRNIKAISDRGSIQSLFVDNPTFLEVVARDNIFMSGYLGNANLYAGGNIESSNGIFAGYLTEKAGGNITTGSAPRNVVYIDSSSAGDEPFSYEVRNLNLSAGTNPFSAFGDTYQIAGTLVKPLKDAWTASGPGNITVSECAWVAGEGGLVGTATGSITMKDIHVSHSLMPAENTTDPRQAQQPLELRGNNGITVTGQIETMGPVTLIAENGNITIDKTIGPHVALQTPSENIWNPYDKGVASLTVRAGNLTTGQGNVSIQSVRAEGNIDIRAYGNGTTTGLVSYGSSAFESVSGTTYLAKYINGNPAPAYTYVAGDDYDTTISATPVDRLPVPLPLVPAVSPGPLMSGPAAPAVPGALPPNAPSVPNVSGTVEPTSPGGSSSEPSGPGSSPSLPGQPDVAVPELAAGSASLSEQVEPERATGSTSLSEIIPGEDEEEEYAEEVENGKETTTSESQGKQKIMVGDGAKDKTIIEFPAGRGVSQSAVSEEILGTSTIPILPYARRER